MTYIRGEFMHILLTEEYNLIPWMGVKSFKIDRSL
jgi:hypothetical protein